MYRFTLASMALLATLGAGTNAFAAHHRSRVHVAVVARPYYVAPYYGAYYGPYYGPYGYGPYYRPYVYDRDAYETSGIRLKVHPNDAQVLVDGYYAGTVDDFDGAFQQLDVKPGKHEITVKHDGYRTYRFRLYAVPGRTVKVAHELAKGSGPDEADDLGGR
jgi:hypothetical protein